MEKQKRTKFFLEEEVPLPLEALMMEEMTGKASADRFRESRKARSTQYVCGFFYKHISRPLPLDIPGPDEGADDDGGLQ
jgi:hypothetical protein